MARFHLGDVAGAQELLDQAVALGPQDFLAWSKRGELWFRLGCFPQAMADLRQALTVEAPTRASMQLAARMLEEAIKRQRGGFVRPGYWLAPGAIAAGWRRFSAMLARGVTRGVALVAPGRARTHAMQTVAVSTVTPASAIEVAP